MIQPFKLPIKSIQTSFGFIAQKIDIKNLFTKFRGFFQKKKVSFRFFSIRFNEIVIKTDTQQEHMSIADVAWIFEKT